MSDFLSDKFKILSFVLIIFVLYIHSGFHADELNGMQVNNFVQDFISGKIGRVAVPLFFMISGYLFFLNTAVGLAAISKKISKRVHSLLLPYIFGCLFFILFFFLLRFVPGASRHMRGNINFVYDNTVFSLLKNIFWISDGGTTPLAFHLWFLRDLILIVAITPLLYYILGWFKWWSLPILFGLTYLTVIPSSIFSSLFWFSLGSVFALTNTNIELKVKFRGYLLLLFYAILSLYEQVYGQGNFIFLQIPVTLLGCIGLWLSYDNVVPRNFQLSKHKSFTTLCGFTFFIYLFHEPTLNVVRKVIVLSIGKNSVGYLVSYLLSPLVFVMFAVICGLVLKKVIPFIYVKLVGGRI